MDWSKLISELQQAGMTQQQIADACGGVGQSTISDLLNKAQQQPRFELGQKLIALHKRRTARRAKATAATT